MSRREPTFSFCARAGVRAVVDPDADASGTGRRIAAHADAPGRTRERERGCSDERDQWRVHAKFGAAEKPRGGIKRCEAKRNNPAQKELDVARVDGERVAAEREEVPERRVDADAVLEPERKCGKK